MSQLCNLPEDISREIWRRVYSGCLQDAMKEATMRLYILDYTMGNGHDLEFDTWDIYNDALELNNMTHEEIEDRFLNEDKRDFGYATRLLDMIDEDHQIEQGKDIDEVSVFQWLRLMQQCIVNNSE